MFVSPHREVLWFPTNLNIMGNFWLKKLNNYYRSLGCKHEIDFSDLIGCKILDLGFHPDAREGGFTIDYEKNGEACRLVLAFNELGMWNEWHGKIESPSPLDLLKERVEKFVDSEYFGLTTIVDDPVGERFSFIDENHQEVFALTAADIKLLPPQFDKILGRVRSEEDEADLHQAMVMFTM